MKRKGDVFDAIIDVENLRKAFYKASKRKHRRQSVRKIEENLDSKLEELHDLLAEGKFHTSAYHTKRIFEPKERTIYILPFWPDRVVQHAILNIIEPYWESLFIKDTYSCLKGRGQHKGSRRTEQFVKHYRYVYKADIHHFYPSLNHAIMKRILRKKLKDPRLLAVLDDIIDSTPGETNVPIGNLMSQWFGNLYLNELDTFVKQELHCKAYVRYCDDFTMYSDSKEQLWEWKRRAEEFVQTELKLELSKSAIFPTKRGVDFLGYRHFPEGYLLVRKSTAKKAKKTVAKVRMGIEAGTIKPETAQGRAESLYGLISWANAHNFMESLELPAVREEAAGYAELRRAGEEAAHK